MFTWHTLYTCDYTCIGLSLCLGTVFVQCTAYSIGSVIYYYDTGYMLHRLTVWPLAMLWQVTEDETSCEVDRLGQCALTVLLEERGEGGVDQRTGIHAHTHT